MLPVYSVLLAGTVYIHVRGIAQKQAAKSEKQQPFGMMMH